MRAINKILLYVLAVVGGGALLAPGLFWLGQWAIQQDVIPQLRPFGFEKYLNRAVLVLALGLLWPLIRGLGLSRWTDLRLHPNPWRLRDLATGLALAVGGLAAVGALLVWGGDLTFKGWPDLPSVLGAVLTGAVVALIEETFFRGALFGVLRRDMSWPVALVGLSLFFAVLHFLRPDPSVGRVQEVAWNSGLLLLPHLFWQFSHMDLLLGTLFTLFLMGCVLGFAVVRTGSLYLAVGLHAGWVFALKLLSHITHITRRPESSRWIGDDMRSGLAPAVLMAATGLILLLLLRRRQKAT